MLVQKCASLDTSEKPTKSQLELQREWQEFLYEKRNQQLGFNHGQKAEKVYELTERIRFNVEAMHQELAELVDHLPWKQWKTYEVGGHEPAYKLPIEELIYEAIDLQHFLNNIYLALGLTQDEVDRFYLAKIKENYRRQSQEYANGRAE